MFDLRTVVAEAIPLIKIVDVSAMALCAITHSYPLHKASLMLASGLLTDVQKLRESWQDVAGWGSAEGVWFPRGYFEPWR